MKEFVQRYKRKYRDRCADLVFNCLGSRKPRMYKIVNMFRYHILICQKKVREWLKLLHFRYRILLNKYEKFESVILQQSQPQTQQIETPQTPKPPSTPHSPPATIKELRRISHV